MYTDTFGRLFFKCRNLVRYGHTGCRSWLCADGDWCPAANNGMNNYRCTKKVTSTPHLCRSWDDGGEREWEEREGGGNFRNTPPISVSVSLSLSHFSHSFYVFSFFLSLLILSLLLSLFSHSLYHSAFSFSLCPIIFSLSLLILSLYTQFSLSFHILLCLLFLSVSLSVMRERERETHAQSHKVLASEQEHNTCKQGLASHVCTLSPSPSLSLSLLSLSFLRTKWASAALGTRFFEKPWKV
jgi:hypothetical protein